MTIKSVLLPMILSQICHWKWIQWHRFPIIWRGNFSRPMLLFVYFGDFSLHMRSFNHITTSGLKSDVIFEFSASVFTRTWLRYVRIFAVAIPSVACLSVCLSVTLVHPTHGVEPFGNISSALSTLAILWVPCKFYRDRPRGTHPSEALNTGGVATCSDFGPIEGYIS